MSHEEKQTNDDLGFEIENDAGDKRKTDDEGISREDAADILKSFNSIFDDEDK